jgi:hypothetical protein
MSSDSPSGTPAHEQITRRRLLRKGLRVGAPMVVSIASMPVTAGNCVVASSYVSVLTFESRNAEANPYTCTIRTREAFLADSTLNSFLNSTKFSAVFTPAPTYTTACNADTKFKELLKLPLAGGENEVAARLAWLHMCLRQPYPMGNMSPDYAKQVWANYKANGNSYVIPGIQWNTAELLTYLRFVLG